MVIDGLLKITIFHRKIHYTWWFSIAMLVYQRVYNIMVIDGLLDDKNHVGMGQN